MIFSCYFSIVNIAVLSDPTANSIKGMEEQALYSWWPLKRNQSCCPSLILIQDCNLAALRRGHGHHVFGCARCNVTPQVCRIRCYSSSVRPVDPQRFPAQFEADNQGRNPTHL